MNGTITLPIDAELAGWLTTGAATRGLKVEDFAVATLRRVARKPTINEVFADVQADFKAICDKPSCARQGKLGKGAGK